MKQQLILDSAKDFDDKVLIYEQQKKNIENLLEQIRLLKFELSETKKENTILKYRLEWREKNEQ